MNDSDFDFMVTLIKDKSGIILTKDKSYLFESRLLPVARRHGMKTVDDLVRALRMKKDSAVVADVVDAMTTNETFFFRDTRPFDQFKNIIMPELIKTKTDKNIRIWCAACSSGQEPYSLGMILHDMNILSRGYRVELIASDLSNSILNKAKEGLYTQFEVQRGLPVTYLVKYFIEENGKWRISDDIKRMIDFRILNLLEIPPLGRFDVIFCRNVLIYFDVETKKMILKRLASMLPKDGTLFLGGTETIIGLTDDFREVEGQRGLLKRV